MSAIQAKIEEDYQLGLFSDKDKHAAIQELSKKTMEKIQDDLFVRMDRDNNIFIMFDSGARGSCTFKPKGLVNTLFDPFSVTPDKPLGKILLKIIRPAVLMKNYENSLHINILSVFQELAEFGFEFSDIFGISISLDDLDFIKNSSNKQFYLDEMSGKILLKIIRPAVLMKNLLSYSKHTKAYVDITLL